MAKQKQSEFVGKTVKAVRTMTARELQAEGWDGGNKPRVIEFTDGSTVYASCDPEGNGPGCLYGKMADGETVYV